MSDLVDAFYFAQYNKDGTNRDENHHIDTMIHPLHSLGKSQ